ncbi:MAG: hypothetical protein K2Y37_00880 [Pirellulales bacterium]|nr:hypothetical protein [Pirellulales bacterium]
MILLADFCLRLACGLPLAMARVSPREVPSGFFRVHLYVVLGLSLLAALTSWQLGYTATAIASAAAAVLSFVGAALWLYEKPRPGRFVLIWIGVIAFFAGSRLMISAGNAATAATSATSSISGRPVTSGAASTQITARPGGFFLHELDLAVGSLLLGTTLAAMLLGHWYLNTPTMKLAPLESLITAMLVCIVARGALALLGLVLVTTQGDELGGPAILFLGLRWLAGIAGTLIVAVMARQTLKIPNTQAATGLLYVAVTTVFLGELTARLLSNQTSYPL